MNILNITESYYPDSGGVSAIMRLLSESLSSRGYNITVATKKNQNRNAKRSIYAIHVANSVLSRRDGRKTAEIWPISKSPIGLKFKIHQKSITTKSQYHMQPTDSANVQGHQKRIDLFGSALNILSKLIPQKQ